MLFRLAPISVARLNLSLLSSAHSFWYQMAFNDSLNFEPSLEKLANETAPFHVILSGFLRKSRTFELYETIARLENLHCRLIPFELAGSDPEETEDHLSNLIDLFRTNPNFQSILVSDPFKHRVQKYSKRIAQAAAACGAVNVLFKDDDIVGENFDGYAFRMGAEVQESITFDGKSMLFFGCGGVSSAVAVHLSGSLSRIGLVDLDEGKAHKLVQLLTSASPDLQVERLDPAGSRQFQKYDFVYNGTGLGKHNSLSPISQTDIFAPHGIAFDANYTPAKTEFLIQMEARSWRSVNGLSHMLMCTAAHLGHVLPQVNRMDGSVVPSVDFATVQRAYEILSF